MSGPWEILGIEPTRDLRAVKRAYAARSAELHPEEHPEEFRQLQEAYEMVVDGLRRASERELFPEREPVQSEAPAGEEEEPSEEAAEGKRLVFSAGVFSGERRSTEEEEEPQEEATEDGNLVFSSRIFGGERPPSGPEEGSSGERQNSGEPLYHFEAVERERRRCGPPDFDGVFTFLEAKAFSPEASREEWQAFFEAPNRRRVFQSQGFCDMVTKLLKRGELTKTAWLELLLLCPQVRWEGEKLPWRHLRRYLMEKKYLKWQQELSAAAMVRAGSCYVGRVQERVLQNWQDFVRSDDFLCAYSLPCFMIELTAYLRRTRELSGQCRRLMIERYQKLGYWPERWERETYLRLIIELACYNGDRGEGFERRRVFRARVFRWMLGALGVFCALGKWVFAAAMIVSFWWDMIHLMLSMKVFEGFVLWFCMLCQMATIAVIYYLIETRVHTWAKKKKRQIIAGLTVVWGAMLSLLLFCSPWALLGVTDREWMLYFFFVAPPAFLTLIIKRTLEY